MMDKPIFHYHGGSWLLGMVCTMVYIDRLGWPWLFLGLLALFDFGPAFRVAWRWLSTK